MKDLNGNPPPSSPITLILPVNGNPPVLEVWTQDLAHIDSSPFTVTYQGYQVAYPSVLFLDLDIQVDLGVDCLFDDLVVPGNLETVFQYSIADTSG